MSSTSDLATSIPFVVAAVSLLGLKSVRSIISSIFERPKQHTIIVRHANNEIKLEGASSATIEQVLDALRTTMRSESETAEWTHPQQADSSSGEGLRSSEPQHGDGHE